MRITPVVASVSLFFACGNPPAPRGAAPPAAAEKAPEQVPDGEDWSRQVAEMNSDRFGRPPTTFRRGHVTKREAPRPTRTANGWTVKFATSAAVTTPAVYEGMVYTSGGFNSKEFYAFDMRTGVARWALDLDDDGPSTAACADRVCVFNTESCTIFAVDSHTGEQLWSWWLGDPLTSAPTIAGGLVFTSYPASSVDGDRPRPPGATHALAAFDLKTGAIRWQLWLDSDVMSAPVVAGDFLYVSTFAGTVMKLEPETGTLRYAVKSRATSAPVVTWEGGRESMYYTRRGYDFDEDQIDGALEMIIRTDDNHPKTRYTAKRKQATYIDEKEQGASGHAAKGKAEDSGNGFGGGAPAAANAEAALLNVGVGSVSTMQSYQGSRILHMGTYNVNTMGDEVVATSADTGDELWSLKLDGDTRVDGGHLGTAPLAAGGRVLVGTIKGEVLELDPKRGAVTKRHAVGAGVRSQPVVDRGWIFVGTADGRLVAIDTRDRTLTGWPMWGGNAARTGAVAAK